MALNGSSSHRWSITIFRKNQLDSSRSSRQRSLRLAASCSFSAASLANGEFGSAGRSRSRGAALVAHGRCDGPLSRLSRPPLSRPPIAAAALVAPAAELALLHGRRLAVPALVFEALALGVLALRVLRAVETLLRGGRAPAAARRQPARSRPRPAHRFAACGIPCCGRAVRGDDVRCSGPRPLRRPRLRRLRACFAALADLARRMAMLMTVAIVARPAFFGTAAGPPDLDHFGRGGASGAAASGGAASGTAASSARVRWLRGAASANRRRRVGGLRRCCCGSLTSSASEPGLGLLSEAQRCFDGRAWLTGGFGSGVDRCALRRP